MTRDEKELILEDKCSHEMLVLLVNLNELQQHDPSNHMYISNQNRTLVCPERLPREWMTTESHVRDHYLLTCQCKGDWRMFALVARKCKVKPGQSWNLRTGRARWGHQLEPWLQPRQSENSGYGRGLRWWCWQWTSRMLNGAFRGDTAHRQCDAGALYRCSAEVQLLH